MVIYNYELVISKESRIPSTAFGTIKTIKEVAYEIFD